MPNQICLYVRNPVFLIMIVVLYVYAKDYGALNQDNMGFRLAFAGICKLSGVNQGNIYNYVIVLVIHDKIYF